jgi:hypothetical protein
MRRVVLAAVVLVCGASKLEAEETCLPLNVASLHIVAEQFSLDPDQVRWMRTELASGRLREPASLDALPGAGPLLREAVATSFCWNAPARVRLQAGARQRESRDEERWSLVGEDERWDVVARFHRDPSQNAVLERGGGRIRSGNWSLALGTLENRQGLGLSVETAGAEPRGSTPRRLAAADWTPTPTLDERVLGGVALGLEPGPWSVSVAGLRSADAPACLALGVTKRLARGGLGCRLAGSEERRAGSLLAWGTVGPSDWSAEIARSREGGALGSAFGLTMGVWRVRGSMIWTGAGYASPLVVGRDVPRTDGGLATAIEARWSGGRGRFIRVLHAEDRRPSSLVARAPTIASASDLEWVEPFRPGLEMAFLWRLRRTEPDGMDSEAARSQEGQSELRWHRGGVSAWVRWEERLGAAASRAWSLGLGRTRDSWAWEFRAVHASADPTGDTASVYFRRAGDWSGWATLHSGTAVGVWLCGRGGGWSVEGSGDGGSGPWTWTLSLERGWGGAS